MCFCGSGLTFEKCCGVFIVDGQFPKTAEQLMRSRFSAYCTKDAKYIHNSYAHKERHKHPESEILSFANSASFVDLTICSTFKKGIYDFVEFKALFISSNTLCTLHENSRFIKENDQWVYLDGDINLVPDIKLKRNDACPCQSGKKFKKCHGLDF